VKDLNEEIFQELSSEVRSESEEQGYLDQAEKRTDRQEPEGTYRGEKHSTPAPRRPTHESYGKREPSKPVDREDQLHRRATGIQSCSLDQMPPGAQLAGTGAGLGGDEIADDEGAAAVESHPSGFDENEDDDGDPGPVHDILTRADAEG
jgi:hypothetical protein